MPDEGWSAVIEPSVDAGSRRPNEINLRQVEFTDHRTPNPFRNEPQGRSPSDRDDHGFERKFDVDPSRRRKLLEGLDDIAQTLKHEEKIAAYEASRTW